MERISPSSADWANQWAPRSMSLGVPSPLGVPHAQVVVDRAVPQFGLLQHGLELLLRFLEPLRRLLDEGRIHKDHVAGAVDLIILPVIQNPF